jgi:aspartate/methionine/tyrosine aminotransferase
MPKTSPTADSVPGSGIREIVNLVIERGDRVLRLEIGEPDFATPAHIVEAALAAAGRGVGYTQSAGTVQLRTALAGRLHRAYGLSYPPEDVIVSQGAVQGLAVTMAALLSPGDEVLVPDPAWPNYEMQALLLGGVPVRYPLRPENGFLPDPADLAARYTSRTRVLVLNSPSNPTGAVFPPGLVRQLVEGAAERGVVVLSDEVYDELIFEGVPALAPAYAPEHVVGVYSFSKTYAMTGWRVGYLAAPAWLAPTLVRLQEPMLSCVSAVSQVAALAALAGPQDCVTLMRDSYRRRRDLAVGLLAGAGIEVVRPQGAFYLMVPLAPGVDSRLAALALVEHGVAVAPGTAFGDEARDHFRISLATSTDVLSQAVHRLVDWYERSGGGRKEVPVIGARPVR